MAPPAIGPRRRPSPLLRFLRLALVASALVCWGGLFAAASEQEPGVFAASYPVQGDPVYETLRADLGRRRYLEALTEHLNALFWLPAALTLEMDRCGEANAYYDPARRKIVGCYELIAALLDTFDKRGSRANLDNHVYGAFTFSLLHEVAHAIIDVWDLPVTGKEEDAADQLATIVLLSFGEEGEAAVVSAAVAFARAKEKLNNSRFAAEHSLSKQRAFSILCWVQGQDTSAPARWPLWRDVPADRSERCVTESAQVMEAWNTILKRALRRPLRGRTGTTNGE
jgi:hypothetical protein